MLCFKVYWQLTIGEDTPENRIAFMNLFYWIKYDKIQNSRFTFRATYKNNEKKPIHFNLHYSVWNKASAYWNCLNKWLQTFYCFKCAW